MGLEEGLKFKKKKINNVDTVKPKTVKLDYSTEGEVEVYGLEISTSTNTIHTDTKQTEPSNNKLQKLKIPIIKLKDV